MLVPDHAADDLSRCQLVVIFRNQGADEARQVMDSPGQPGEAIRQHARSCSDCRDILEELYPDGATPVVE